jgi:glycosyltransferase involved in cell wall biosynthesis
MFTVSLAGQVGATRYCTGSRTRAGTAHPLFDADFYLNTYGDVADAGCNPLHHYLTIGWREGRNPHPLFDTEYYLAGVPDLRAQGLCPLVHYVEIGWRERRRSVPDFDPIFYQSAYPDLGPEVDLLLHYVEHGRAEGRLARESRPFVAPARPKPVAIARPAAPVDSQHLPVALMIDAFCPRPDHDSGSLDQISFVRIFQRLGFEVHFLGLLDFHRDHHDDTPHYRQSLRDMGVTVVTSEDYPFIESYYFDQSERITLAFGSRVHFGGHQLATLRQLCPAARTIFNTVDLHFIREQREGELKHDPAIQRQAAQTRDLECAISANADATIVVSTSEKDILGQLVPEANITVVPLIREFAAPSDTSFASRSAIGFIGGFMHQPNIDAVEYFLDAIWPGLHRRRPDLIFRVIGADMPATMRDRRVEGVEFVGYVADLEAELAKLRLTIAPLRFGAGAKGKLVSSLGSGVPSVVSNVAVEGMGLVDDETVLVAPMDSSFADQIIRLYDDQALWQRLSDAGVALMRRNYSLDTGTTLMREILTGISVEPPRGS